MTEAQFNVYLRHFATYFSKITNPNPSPTGKKFGFVLLGTPPTQRSFRALTRTGLSILTETTAVNTDDDEGGNHREDNGKSRGSHLRSEASSATELRELLDTHAETKDKNDVFHETLLDAVIDDMATPLTYAIDIAGNTKINLDKYSQNQRYNIWRLSHVNAMFLCCISMREREMQYTI